MSGEDLPASLKARILADAPKVRARRRVPVAVLSLVAAAWAVTFAVVHGTRSNWSTLPESATWLTLAELVVLAAIVSVTTLVRGRTMLGPAARWLLVACAAPLVGLVGVALTTSPGAHPVPPGRFLAAAVGCDVSVLLAAVPLLALLLWRQRDRILASPGRVGAVAGIAAAAWGHALLHWSCPWTDLQHVLFGHVLPAIPLAISGAILASWLQRRRTAAKIATPD